MDHEDIAKKAAAFTSRFVPMNIIYDVIDAIYDAGMYITIPTPGSATEVYIPQDCTDLTCQDLAKRIPGDCELCKNRKEAPIV